MRYLFYGLWLTLLIWGLMPPVRALAHPQVVRTEPANDAHVEAAPTHARIVFNEPVEDALSTISLYDGLRHLIAQRTGHAPGDPLALELSLPALAPGVYTVVWQTVGSDGHGVKGSWSFTVLPTTVQAAPISATPLPTASPALSPPTASESLPLSPLPALLRALMLVGALGGSGAWLVGTLALAAIPVPTNALRWRWRWTIIACLVLLILSALLMFLVHTAAVANSVRVATLYAVATTRYGEALLARLLLGAALLGTLTLDVRSHTAPKLGWRKGLGLLLSSALLLSFALAGHATGQPQPLLPILTQWFHLAATALWVGGMLMLMLLLPLVSHEESHTILARFSAIALVSVLVLAATGTYSATLLLPRWSDLWNSFYGQVLLVKLALFAGLLLFGAYQRLIALPQAARYPQYPLYLLRFEVVLALGLLATVGLLTSLSPPPPLLATSDSAVALPVPPPTNPMPTRTPVPSQPFAQTQAVADLQVRLAVAPASIESNRFEVEVRDENNLLREVQLVRLTCTMREMDMGTRVLELMPHEQGRYTGNASILSMVGDWQVRVLVRRIDAADAEVVFTVPVGE